MAHYAFLDSNNKVTHIIVGRDENDRPANVASWETFYGQLEQQRCVRTSYNTRGGIYYDPETNQPADDQSGAFRKNYARQGFSYDEERDAFVAPQPFDSWILNEDTCLWEAPIPYPADGAVYTWDETLGDWVEVQVQ